MLPQCAHRRRPRLHRALRRHLALPGVRGGGRLEVATAGSTHLAAPTACSSAAQHAAARASSAAACGGAGGRRQALQEPRCGGEVLTGAGSATHNSWQRIEGVQAVRGCVGGNSSGWGASGKTGTQALGCQPPTGAGAAGLKTGRPRGWCCFVLFLASVLLLPQPSVHGVGAQHPQEGRKLLRGAREGRAAAAGSWRARWGHVLQAPCSCSRRPALRASSNCRRSSRAAAAPQR